MYSEVRFKTLQVADAARAADLLAKEKSLVERRYKEYKYIADRSF
jgi:pyruvate-ferredoxin/flavodoxin oxidoreductase